MTTRYSTCHYAEVMDYYFIEKTMPPTKTLTPKCSFCGELCELVPMELTLQHDLELTLRRWKDGDCTLDDMFDRVNKELYRSWYAAFKPVREALQASGTPKYTRAEYSSEWVKVDDVASDLVVKSPEATDE